MRKLKNVAFLSKRVKMLISPECVTAEMLISLDKQRNVDFREHISSKIWISFQTQFCKMLISFIENSSMFISRQHKSSEMLISLKKHVDFTSTSDLKGTF